MKNSTFSAQVANNLLTLLQGYSKTIRFLLVMLLTLTVTTNAWAEEVTYVFTSKAWAAKIGSTVANWTSNKAGAGFSNNGIQVTTAATGANGTSPISYNNISQIVVTYNTNKSKGKGTLSVKIGDNAVTTNNWQYSGSADGTSANFTSTFDYPSPQSGKVTLTANTTTNSIYVVSIKIVTSAGSGSTPDPCTTPTVAWYTKPANGEVGGSMTASVTTNYSNGLTYSSSNQTVATVTDAGFINYLSAGTTTITATVTGDGTTFCEGPVSVQQEITVTAPAGGGGDDDADTWTLVKNVNDLAAGDQVVIAASGSDHALSTTQNNNNRGQAAVTKNGETITFGNDVQVLTLQTGNVNGTLAFYTGNGYLHAASSSSNYLRTETTLSNNSSWTITITNTGIATIKAQGTYTKNWLRYNSSSSIFSCYSSGQGDVSIYKKGGSGGGGSTPDPDPIPVTSVSLDKTSHTMNEGETVTLTATVLPANADDPSVSWESDNEAVAKVNNGVVTAVSPGNATITVTTTDGGHTATCTITVNALPTVEGTWTLVTNATNLKAGDEIVIASNTKGKVAAALTGDYLGEYGVSFSNDKSTITKLPATALVFTLGGSTGSWTLTNDEKLLGATAAKKLAWDKGTTTWSISIEEGNATIQNATDTYGRFLHNVQSTRFTTYTSDANANMLLPQIYKKAGNTPDPIKLATPENLSVSGVTASSATLSWTEVEHASGYIVNLGGNEHETNTNSLILNDLTASTTYKWTVKAKGDGINYSDSENSSQSSFTTDAATYTITYVTNGGTKIDETSGTALPDPLPETTRDHYTFAGWYTDEGCTQAAKAGAEINANTTLYAKWTPITYTVTFNAGSGTCATEPTQGDFATGLELPTATPCDYASTNGWSFVGWSESSVSETTVRPAIHTGNYKPTKNITLHAVYAKTGTAQGAAGEFILSLLYESTTYYVGQTFDNNKLSAETEQTNAARFTIEDNYLHYEGGYISHVATTSSPNITKQADKANAKAWTITEEDNTVIFTSTADNTRGLGFNYNSGSPRFAAYQLSNDDYPHTFTKTSVSDAAIDVTTYNSNPSCEAPVDPNWVAAEINHSSIQVECGSKTLPGAADPNGPATISFSGTDLVNPVTVTASNGFLVSTYKTNEASYTSSVTVNPVASGDNKGKITQQVYVIAQAPAQSGDFTGTITLTGADITGGSQVINVTADVTCTTYTITWSVNSDTELIAPTTFYAGGDWTLPENPTYECNGREFVGWTTDEILQPQDIAPNVLYKEQGEFPTIESNTTFYAVFAKKGTDDGSGNSGDTKTITLPRPSKTANGYQTGTTEDSEGNTWSYYATLNNQSGTYCYGLNSNSNNYHISSPIFGGTIKSISFKAHNGSSSANRKFLFCSSNTTAQPTTGDLAEVTIPKSESFSQIYTADLSQLGVNQFHIYVAAALSITDIAVTYTTGSSTSSTTYTSYTTSCADVKAIRIVEPTTKTFNEGDKFVFDGKVWAINSDDSETDVTNSPSVRFDVDMYKVGEQTVTVSYLGFTATYEITINAVEKWQITWNVSGATNTGLSPATVVKGQAIGKLPNPKAIPDGCDGKTFVGWTESNTVNSDGTEITFITSSTVPTQNTTYYAVFATPSGNAGDGDYVKLTETPADLSGDYLIVYEAGNLAFNGGLGTLDAASNTISVTIDGNTIESTDATDAAKFIITKNGDAYIITSASNYHIGQTSDANGLQSSTSTSYTNTITITEGNANIISGGAYLRFNSASNQNRFRYYSSSTYTNQKSIALYKKSGSSASYTDYTTGCHDVTITYYGFTGGYTTNCGGSDLNVITQRVNSEHTIPNCSNITDPTDLGRTFLNLWKDQNGKEHKPGDSFIVTQDITLYAQWKLETTGNITLPADKEDLATTDIVVTGGKTLTIPEGKTITINSLTLKGGLLGEDSKSGYAMPSVVIPDDATLVRKNTTINLDLVVNNDSWYPFAVPFAVANNSNIDYLDPVLKAASTYNTHFAIKTYDGKNRAIVGTDQENNWDKVLQTAGLQPGKGYIISALTYPDKDTATIRIPMSVPNEWLANGEQTTVNDVTRNAVAVTAYTGAAATEHQRHAGWNFVANPYLSNFAGTNANGSFINGEILINKGDYSYGGEDVPYVTIPTYNFEHYYQLKLSDATLSPAYSFFVQVGTDGTMTFDVAGRQAAPASIAARNAEERPVKMDVDITLSDNHSSDITGIIISDRYTDAYEIGRDLEKLFGSAYNLSVYTLMADNTPLAFQALAIRSSMQVIPVGYRAPEQGEYTFRLNEATSSIDLLNEQYEQLVLVDYQTGELTNLLIADYTFYSERTQADNRFAIYAVPRQNAPTDLPNAIGQDKQAQKIIHNGHLYILRDGNVYNGNGQIVK